MTPRPWAGVWRGVAIGVLQLLLRRRPWAAQVGDAPPDWLRVGSRRRWTLLALIAFSTALAMQVLISDDAQAFADPMHGAQTVLFGVLFAWVAAGFYTALMGFYGSLRDDRAALTLDGSTATLPIDAAARTAVLVPICNEDIATVFGGLRATCDSLRATGHAGVFDVFVLSDTRDGTLRAGEMQAWAQLREQMQGAGELPTLNVYYRWRRRRSKRKAGNVADFCRRWGRDYRYMVVMDADSVMSGDCIVSLVKLMEAHPSAGIVQTAPQGGGHDSLHARAQAFLGRVVGPLFTRGLAYWQLGESHYWGHNAILRVEPFMKHCALAALPGRGGLSGEILSHDFVEAALMRRAGYEVWLAPQLDGSYEQLPAHLVDELQRDRRWCQGNLQNARLIAEPGFRGVHRAMFLTGALSYLASPLWLAFVLLGAWRASIDHGALPHAGLTLWSAVLVMLFLPRLLGVASILARGEHRRFGGATGLLTGALVEALLSALQAPVRMAAHTLFVLIALTGWKLEWKSPSRAADALGWRDAAASLRWLTLPLAAACAGLVLNQDIGVALGVAPLLVPLLLAVPLAVLTSQPALGRALRRWGVLAIPDELRPARPLREARRHMRAWRGSTAALPSAPSGATLAPAGMAQRWGFSSSLSMRALTGSLALALAALLTPAPSVDQGPRLAAEELIESLRRAQLERIARLQATSFQPVATTQKASLQMRRKAGARRTPTRV